MHIAIVGSGVSGIGAAKVLARLGHEVIIFEKSAQIGGVWARAYDQVRLQNVAAHYRFTDFDWPFPIDEHPGVADVLAYLEAAVLHYGLDVRRSHEVVSMSETPKGWQLEIAGPQGKSNEHFDHVIIAVGLFSGEQADMELADREKFEGQLLSERTLGDISAFAGKRVAVIGFGKTAVDLASMSADHGAKVTHIFRQPRWLLPRRVLGRNIADIAAARISTRMTPSWVHWDKREAIMHKYFPWSVKAYWKASEWLFRATLGLHPFYFDPKVRKRMAALSPDQALTYQMRAAAALAPDRYFGQVRTGAINPVQGNVKGLDKTGVALSSGEKVAADTVIIAVGYKAPEFSFLPEKYKKLMTKDADGAQLYRHVVHPGIPRLAFAGFNHCYMHMAGVEIATLWYGAVIAGHLELPSEDEMLACTARITAWKQTNSLFEPTRAYGVGGRFHNYLDILLAEMGLKAKRKPGALRDHFLPYLAKDYAGVFDEYEKLVAEADAARKSLPFDA